MQLYSRDIGEGTPLVLLHAFPLSSAMWLPQREGLAGRMRVITPDLRGFGGSPLGDTEPSLDTMADDIAALLDDKSITRAVVGGLSLGGRVALAFRRRHPDRALGLVLAGTTAGPDPDAVRRERLAVADRLEAEGSVNVLLEDVLPVLVGPTTMRQRALVYGRVRGLVQAAPPRAAAWAQRALAGPDTGPDSAAGIQTPVLVIQGAEDTLTAEDGARRLAATLPNAELIVIPRAGHLTAVEQPHLFNEAVAEFVAALGRTAGPARRGAGAEGAAGPYG